MIESFNTQHTCKWFSDSEPVDTVRNKNRSNNCYISVPFPVASVYAIRDLTIVKSDH